MGRQGIREAYATGRGSIIIALNEVQTNAKDREAIIIHEIPYQVNKAQAIGEMVREKTTKAFLTFA